MGKLVFPFYRGGNRGSERLNNEPKITQLMDGGARNDIQNPSSSHWNICTVFHG